MIKNKEKPHYVRCCRICKGDVPNDKRGLLFCRPTCRAIWWERKIDSQKKAFGGKPLDRIALYRKMERFLGAKCEGADVEKMNIRLRMTLIKSKVATLEAEFKKHEARLPKIDESLPKLRESYNFVFDTLKKEELHGEK